MTIGRNATKRKAIKPATVAALAAALLIGAAASPASSRIWKGTPNELARDYLTINDTRANGEFVLLMWFAAPMVQPSSPGAPTLKALLDKYVVLTAVHAKLDRTTGSFTFETLDALQASNQAGKPLTFIARNDLPPTVTAVLAGVEAMFRQAAGAMGAGMKVFVFDTGDVNSCKPGGLSVPLAGDTYTWQTPIPGCPGQ